MREKNITNMITMTTANVLRKKHFWALLFIAIILFTNQLVVNSLLDTEIDDAIVINVSGRQRMLSQKIIKESLSIKNAITKGDRIENIQELNLALSNWVLAHNGLIYGDITLGLPGNNPIEVEDLFDDITTNYVEIVTLSEQIIEIAQDDIEVSPDIDHLLLALDDETEQFLLKMDVIVKTYESESKRKHDFISAFTWLLMGLVLLVLYLELLLIFRPLEKGITSTIQNIKKSEENLRQLFDQSPSPLILVSEETNEIVRLNLAASVLLGSDVNNIIGNQIESYLTDEFDELIDLSRTYQKTHDNNDLEVTLINDNQKEHHVILTVEKYDYFDQPVYIIGLTDISDRKINELLLKQFAQIDELTKLYNRRTGLSILEKDIATLNRVEEMLTIVFIDLDNLKFVNDHFGHTEGDYFIKSFSQSVHKNIRTEDYAFRYGGDEFIIVLRRCGQTDAKNVINLIMKELSQLSKTQKPYDMTMSAGYASYMSGEHKSIQQFIDVADEAMYKNKQAKKVKTDDILF